MKKIYHVVLGAICVMGISSANAQCTINATAAQATISCGGSTQLAAIPNVPSSISFQDNFNTGTATGWATTSNAMFTNPCGPSLDGSTYLHMGDQPLGGAPRNLATNPLNITCMGTVCFDFVIQSGFSAPCEDADANTEGVYLQYSTNGVTWTTLTYYDASLTTNDVWMNICVNIPAGALSPTTQFRWIQTMYSGDTFDHWSIDNVVITGTCTSTYTPSWLPSTGLSSTTILNPVASPTITTTYTVTYTDGTNTCTSAVTITVNGPTADAGLPQSICLGQNATLNGSGATNASATTSFTQTNPVPITDVSTSTSTLTVSGLPFTAITTTDINQVCFDLNHTWDSDLSIYLQCPGGTQLALSLTNGGSGDNYTNTCFTPSATNVIGSTGNNTPPFTGTFAPEGAGGFAALNGCTANGTWTLVVVDGAGGDVGTINNWTMIFNTPSNPTISWAPTGSMTGSTTFTPTVTPATTTVYTLSVSSVPGCVATDTVSVLVSQLTGVTAGSDQTICNGGSTGLTASGGTTFSWSPSTGLNASNISNPVASPSVTTDYTVTVSSGGCSGLDTVQVVVNALPNVDAGANTTICSGASVNLNATGAPNFIWTPATDLSSTTISNPVSTPSATVTYYVTGTDVNSCSKT
ncbi:MAG: proprotein convertase P-domain-containing protein, partial [Bacteroidia bacterium]